MTEVAERSQIADLDLAPTGHQAIEWARQHSPVVDGYLRQRLSALPGAEAECRAGHRSDSLPYSTPGTNTGCAVSDFLFVIPAKRRQTCYAPPVPMVVSG